MESMRSALTILCLSLLSGAMLAQTPRRSFELETHRMDVDVDGSPTAYGPPGYKTLDILQNAHTMGNWHAPIVGFMTEHGKPLLQGPNDPAPGYYISQTAFEDESRPERDPRRYVDATQISYVVLGNAGRRRGVKLGDFVAVYSTRTHRSVWAIVGDSGNPSGDEGSLHLLQALGYPFHDGRNDAVEERGEIIVRYFPGSNPKQVFFREQAALDAAAEAAGLSRDFAARKASK
jgi:hypothetical protein